MAFRLERSGAFHFVLFERLAIRGVVRGDRAMFGRTGAWRMTGSAVKWPLGTNVVERFIFIS